jgi:hypothetical protein
MPYLVPLRQVVVKAAKLTDKNDTKVKLMQPFKKGAIAQLIR